MISIIQNYENIEFAQPKLENITKVKYGFFSISELRNQYNANLYFYKTYHDTDT